jgi:hemoglobin/transferrin/lactoferrin receptor protein
VQQAQLTLSYQNGEELQDRVRRDGRGELSGHDIDTLGLDLQLESDTPIGYLVYGLDYYHDSVDSFRTDFIEGTTKRKARIQGPVADDSSYDLLGVYLQDDITLTEKVHLYLGGRYTYAKAELGRFENPITKEAQSFSQSWNNAVFSARTELALDSEQHYILFGGVSQGFRAPNLSDLSRLDIARSGELEVGSTELDPEKFISYEIGVKARTDHFTGSFSYFYTSIQDIIARKPTGRIIEDQVEVTKANAGSGFVHGAELAGSWQITEQWNLFGNVTFIKGEADNFPGSTRRIQREPLSRIQPLTGTAGVRWTAKDQKVWAELVCTATARADDLNSADREDTQRIPPNGTPGYVLINLRSGWNVTKNVTLLASLDNVLNEAYRVHGSGSNEPGIGATLGVKLAF